ncbi:MAG: glycosyl hydrolase, partial [Armatimonadota bacterium]
CRDQQRPSMVRDRLENPRKGDLTMMRIHYWAVCVLMAWAIVATASCAPDLPTDAAQGADVARAFRAQAERLRQAGDPQAALVYESKADQCDLVLIGYRSRAATATELRSYYTGQKGEPIYGCYIGVHCFRDERVTNSFTEFCNLTRKRHAMIFDYARKDDIDAHMWEAGDRKGPFLQSAFEPGDLRKIVPGPDLENWARALGGVGRTVFLRWGSEMNGDWLKWHGDPKLYIEKWRLVHDTMERLAPNVAMVWCPNATPQLQIDCYYPGDDYVDWVGVNFYVVTIHDGDKRYSARNENPADLFKHVYAKYASRKPIMICETGVTHKAQGVNTTEIDFAANRIGHLYGCLPRLYPRLKAICYYDVDNIKNTDANRNLNNYLITDSERLLDAYCQAIAPDYFLSAEQKPDDPLPEYVEPLANGQTLSGKVTLSAWAKSLIIAPVVEYRLDGKVLGTSCDPGTYNFEFDCTAVTPGAHVLALAMLDQNGGRVLKQVNYKINVGTVVAGTPKPTSPPAAGPAQTLTPGTSNASVTEDAKLVAKKGFGAPEGAATNVTGKGKGCKNQK